MTFFPVRRAEIGAAENLDRVLAFFGIDITFEWVPVTMVILLRVFHYRNIDSKLPYTLPIRKNNHIAEKVK